jgi:lysine-ketoglutarate reductase/saccharopine dehydrogenase-like protein (TIGR00300 family)
MITKGTAEEQEIELKGHIIDSLILPRIFDAVMDMGGDFEVLEFKIGKHKSDESYARLVIKAESRDELDIILSEMHAIGATIPEMEGVVLGKAPKDHVMPDKFYSTTHHPTYIHHGGKWIKVQDTKMDSAIVVAGDKAYCRKLCKVKKGDLIVIGQKGVRVEPPSRPRKKSLFGFMTSSASSERPSQTLIRQIAGEMLIIKKNGGRIAVVAGPAVVHTGASPALASLVKMGYVSVLLAGNALPTHDIELSVYGTSLGVEISKNIPVSGGHKNHLQAISDVIDAGSIKKAVDAGIIKSGIMYECVKNNVPYVLAGSIRDDGPLPDVITDAIEAQDAYLKALKGVDLVLMMSTMLHSIAVGNLLPSTVKTICIDIDSSTVTKLIDRGTAQAIGIVTDVGIFLPALVNELKALERKASDKK